MTPENIAAAARELERDEGRRLVVYDDATGKTLRPGTTLIGNPTIGIGRNLLGRGISDEEADYLLAHDIRDHWDALRKALPWVERLDPVRQRVLLSMSFMGVEKLLQFRKMLSFTQAGQYRAAAVEILASTYAAQVGVRADRLAAMMRDGVSAG